MIQAYSEPCVVLAYSETSYIWEPLHFQNQRDTQNPGTFRTLAYSKSETCSEPRQTSAMERFAKIVNSHNLFRNISFSRSPIYKINMINTCQIFTHNLKRKILKQKIFQKIFLVKSGILSKNHISSKLC